MLHCVALVKTDIPEERSASIIRVTRIGEPGTTLAVTSNQCTLQRKSVLTRATQHNIPEDGILHIQCRENLRSYKNRLIYDVPETNTYINMLLQTLRSNHIPLVSLHGKNVMLERL
jgi:hypothetical protein